MYIPTKPIMDQVSALEKLVADLESTDAQASIPGLDIIADRLEKLAARIDRLAARPHESANAAGLLDRYEGRWAAD